VVTIVFNAFSFLQEKLKAQGLSYVNVSIEIGEGTTIKRLITDMGLDPGDVEAAFINGHAEPLDTSLHSGDRVALVPSGTPGPYRVLLGMVNKHA